MFYKSRYAFVESVPKQIVLVFLHTSALSEKHWRAISPKELSSNEPSSKVPSPNKPSPNRPTNAPLNKFDTRCQTYLKFCKEKIPICFPNTLAYHCNMTWFFKKLYKIGYRPLTFIRVRERIPLQGLGSVLLIWPPRLVVWLKSWNNVYE